MLAYEMPVRLALLFLLLLPPCPMHQLVHPTSEDVFQILEVVPNPSELVFDRFEPLLGKRFSLLCSEGPHSDSIMTPMRD